MASSKPKKMSAFSIFKARKTSSMSAMDDISDVTPSTPDSKRSSSAANTPTGSQDTSISSFMSRFSGSEKRKQKADAKKLKKILKHSASKGRPSYLPDSAVHSPLAELHGGNVQLRSLRPKGSMANLRYKLPLKSDPDVPVSSLDRSPSQRSTKRHTCPPGVMNGIDDSTPPLPPRPKRFSSSSSAASPMDTTPRQASKRGGRRSTDLPPFDSGLAGLGMIKGDEVEGIPPRPPKRRKLNEGKDPSPRRSVLSEVTKSPAMLCNSYIDDSFASPMVAGGRERTEAMPMHPAENFNGMPYMYDSQQEASRLFECLIHPVKPQKFFSELWEKKPLLVKRHMPNYNDGWFSTAEMDKILRENRIMFSVNLDVTTFTDGKRETHNPVGRAHAPVVWDYYQNGCSVRMLNPQTYSHQVWKMSSVLQEYFNCFVGANVYLTPPGTQGFAPHYDDIEAFILQLEGKKHWRLYSPRRENEALPRFSSSNMTEGDVGEPILDVILEAGDLLYFPKGVIHQGNALEDDHSLHITVSCCQMNTWGDFLERLVPRALEIAMEEDIDFRKSLPRDYVNYMGVAFSDSDCPERKAFLKKIEQFMMRLITHAPVDGAADQMAKKFLHESLPPVLTEAEKESSIHGNGEKWDGKSMRVRGAVELEPDTEVKIIRKGVLRLITEEEKVCVYYNLENTRIIKEVELQFLEITPDMAPSVEMLLHAYPDFVKIDDFPMDSVEEKVDLAASLYEKGLLITRVPLDHLSETSSEGEAQESHI